MENDKDSFKEIMDEERRDRGPRKSYFIIMMVLSFIMATVTYRSCIKIFYS